MCDGQHGYRRRATASGGEGEELEKGVDSGDHDVPRLARQTKEAAKAPQQGGAASFPRVLAGASRKSAIDLCFR